ncbi:MAG: TIGR02300 family protein [Holosporaceae bacterium]|jgi:uncharacterized protein (TIGR02300 family)|nr:TIGR02300 family protein [Holosporaceae bacterium]
MDREDWGVKRICLSCGARFYDFNKSPIVCPSCSAIFDPEYLLKRKSKTIQEKSEDSIDDVEQLDDEDLIDDSEEELDEDAEEIVLGDDKN